MQLQSLTPLNFEFSLLIVKLFFLVFPLTHWCHLRVLFLSSNDISADLQIARQSILYDNWCLEVYIEVSWMLSLLFGNNCVLISVIKVSLDNNLF